MTRFLLFCKHLEGIIESMLKTLVCVLLCIVCWKVLAWVLTNT